MVMAAIGLQFGDEGKGKVVDFLAQKADWIVRFNGGPNTGCTVVEEEKRWIFHHIPAGVTQGKQVLLGPGMVIHPPTLVKEIQELEKSGIELKGSLFISYRSHLILPSHIEEDHRKESQREKPIGTTKRGVGPAYSAKMARTGQRIIDALEAASHPYQKELNFLSPYLCHGVEKIHQVYREDKAILLEGAQGSLLDIDFGTYPYVTSSNTVSSNAPLGSGLPPHSIHHVLGICKAYTTRVGEGPFPTEAKEDTHLGAIGQEFGATTGRKRRCGWLDLFALKYTCMVNGVDSLALTKIDVLSGLPEIPVCTGYRYKGKLLSTFPASTKVLQKVEPEYASLKGWDGSVQKNGKWRDEVQEYLNFVSAYLEIPISIVSIGPERHETVVLEDPWMATTKI